VMTSDVKTARPDDTLREIIQKMVKFHIGSVVVVQEKRPVGIDVFRVFDALNDARNMETAIRTVRKVGRHAQGTICYTISPVHTARSYVRVAKELTRLVCDQILHPISRQHCSVSLRNSMALCRDH